MTLYTTPKAQSMKEIVDKLNFIIIKNVCSAKDTIRRIRRQVMDWGKIIAKDISDKSLWSKLYKEL